MNHPKPLTVTLAEAAGRPMLAVLSDEKQRREAWREPTGRPAPPSSRVHQLPPPAGPDRSLVAPPEPKAAAEMAAKKRGRRKFLPEDKAKAVARVKAGETQAAVAKSLGVTGGVVSQWMAQAKKDYAARSVKRLATIAAKKTQKAAPNGAPASKPAASDLTAIALELAQLDARRAVLKAKLLDLVTDS